MGVLVVVAGILGLFVGRFGSHRTSSGLVARCIRSRGDWCTRESKAHQGIETTADGAENPANEVSEERTVRTGHREDSDDWVVQSVLIPEEAWKSTAESEARAIVETLEG